MTYGVKRQRSDRRREPSLRMAMDSRLNQANHEAADTVRLRINAQVGKECFRLPPCQFRHIAQFKQLDIVARPPGPQNLHHDRQCAMCEASRASELQLSHSTSTFLTLEQQRYAILYDQLVLSPIQHVQSTLYLDEVAYTELRNYQKTLVRMFHEQDKAVLFVETSLGDPYHKNKEEGRYSKSQHCYIQCFPVPFDMLQDAKDFFLKAITDLLPEWAQNKKLISITGKTGVRGSIPKGFDFLHVDYSLSGEGIACVIDDPSRFPPSFSREVVAGMLKMDSLERAFRSRDRYMQAFSWLKKQYKNYDWNNVT